MGRESSDLFPCVYWTSTEERAFLLEVAHTGKGLVKRVGYFLFGNGFDLIGIFIGISIHGSHEMLEVEK